MRRSLTARRNPVAGTARIFAPTDAAAVTGPLAAFAVMKPPARIRLRWARAYFDFLRAKGAVVRLPYRNAVAVTG